MRPFRRREMCSMNEPRIRGLMGLCVRARMAVFGEGGCLKSVRSGNCGLVLLDSGASAAAQEKYRGACGHAGVPLRILPKGLLGEATGRPGVAMALQPGGICQQLLTLLPETEDQLDTDTICGGASIE